LERETKKGLRPRNVRLKREKTALMGDKELQSVGESRTNREEGDKFKKERKPKGEDVRGDVPLRGGTRVSFPSGVVVPS